MRRSCAWLSLPEHPREQDCVTRPLPSLFRLRPLPTPVASCQLPERPLTGQAVCARAERAKSERRKANSDEFKPLFWNILPITPTGSIFCGGNFFNCLLFSIFCAGHGGEGKPDLWRYSQSGNGRSDQFMSSNRLGLYLLNVCK